MAFLKLVTPGYTRTRGDCFRGIGARLEKRASVLSG
jgi:hypothetical protein